MIEYIPTNDACHAFLEAAVSAVTDEGKVPSMNVGKGLYAAVQVDATPILTALLTLYIAQMPPRALSVEIPVTAQDVLALLRPEPGPSTPKLEIVK